MSFYTPSTFLRIPASVIGETVHLLCRLSQRSKLLISDLAVFVHCFADTDYSRWFRLLFSASVRATGVRWVITPDIQRGFTLR